ncbi:MAG: dihydrodipicolinate synthase family protein [Verrucomicrobia bacterium]|nr:dihydrodipicolinate synthase family protein [Verrucomicrobiota bacterium]
MSSPFRPSGIYSAQWLPVDSAGRLDRASLATHVAFEKQAGIDGFLGLGSTGEFPHFSPDERKQVLAALAELAAPLPVIANITDIRPRVAVELGRFAKSLGLPAVSLMPPMFFPMSQDDILAYFLHVAEAVDLPVMLYNFPELTGKRIDLPTIAAFADRAPMCAIKQSGGEFAYHRDLIALGREKHYAVMSGADTRLTEVFALGGAGCTGGLVNLVPELMLDIHRCCAAGRVGDAAESAARMVQFGRVIDQLAFPPNVAAGLAARGFQPGAFKSILSPVSQDLVRKIERELRALYVQWGLALGPLAA